MRGRIDATEIANVTRHRIERGRRRRRCHEWHRIRWPIRLALLLLLLHVQLRPRRHLRTAASSIAGAAAVRIVRVVGRKRGRRFGRSRRQIAGGVGAAALVRIRLRGGGHASTLQRVGRTAIFGNVGNVVENARDFVRLWARIFGLRRRLRRTIRRARGAHFRRVVRWQQHCVHVCRTGGLFVACAAGQQVDGGVVVANDRNLRVV